MNVLGMWIGAIVVITACSTVPVHTQYVHPIGSPYGYNAIRTTNARPIVTSDTTFAWGVQNYEWVYSIPRQLWYSAEHGGFKHDPSSRLSQPVVGRDGLWYYTYEPNEIRSFDQHTGDERVAAAYPKRARAAIPYLHPSGLIMFAPGDAAPFGLFWPEQELCVLVPKDFAQFFDRGILVTRNGTMYYVGDRGVQIRLMKSTDCGVSWTQCAVVGHWSNFAASGPMEIGSSILFEHNSMTFIYDDENGTLDSTTMNLVGDGAVTKGDTAYFATGCSVQHSSKTGAVIPYNMDSGAVCTSYHKGSPFIGQYQPYVAVELPDGRLLLKPGDTTETFSISTASVRPMSIHQVGYDCDTLRLWVNGDLRSSVQWRGYEEAGYSYLGSSESPLRTEYLFRKDRSVPVGPYIVATAGEAVDSIRPLLQEPAASCVVRISATTIYVPPSLRDVIAIDTTASTPIIMVRWYRNGVPVQENYRSYGDEAMYLLSEPGEYHVVAMTTTFCTVESNHVVYDVTSVESDTVVDSSPIVSVRAYTTDGRCLMTCATVQECREFLDMRARSQLTLIVMQHENGRVSVLKHVGL